MRRRVFALLFCCFLLVSCTDSSGASRVVEVQELYASLASYSAETSVAVSREAETLYYTLDVEKDTKDATITVVEPETLSGVSAHLGTDGVSLEYDGLLLDVGAFHNGISAVNCVPLTIQALSSGYLLEQNTEEFNGEEALRVSLESECSGEMLHYIIWLSPDNAPLYAEILEEENILIMIEFTNFSFGDIMSSQ